MKENMLDLLLYLFDHCYEAEIECLSQADLVDELTEAGFKQEKILQTVAWLATLSHGFESLSCLGGANGSFRMFSDRESEKLGEQGMLLLHWLQRNQIIQPTDREWIINRVMALDINSVSLNNLKWIIMMVLTNIKYIRQQDLLLVQFALDQQSSMMH